MAESQGPGDVAVNGTPKAHVPYEPQDPAVIAKLVRELEEHTKGGRGKGSFRIKKTKFAVAGSASKVTVDSWKLQDWDYKKRDLPTYARGLFTTRLPNNVPEIAVRGYDKFFNVGEVPDTEWNNIISNSVGPYELSLKENGCIIFVSGLHDGTLLVCSKHSTGARSDIDISHANAGERALEKQLAKIGKTKLDLARELRARNATAIAELCDDSFEEHILAYGPDKAGLYLHGINVNQPYFMTYPGSAVNAFADEWAFQKTGLLVMDDIHKVKTFLEDVAQTGAYDGRDVEGFVIRCKLKGRPNTDPNAYSDWFFKYKFEEPYLMYRQWRECTKALIAGNTPKFKKHRKITEEYLQYAKRRLVADPKLAKLYNQNHGIIALRDDFLKYKNMKGSDAANLEEHDAAIQDLEPMEPGPDQSVVGDVVLVPIATIGCGKTTVAVALQNLFPAETGHVQNDDIKGKNRPPRFTKEVTDLLAQKRFVVADRNNAERREREQILRDVKRTHPSAKLVALNFAHEDLEQVRRVTQERVFQRGNRHQTIQADSQRGKVVGIMKNFLDRFQEFSAFTKPDADFDAAIHLNATAGSRQNLELVVNKLHKFYPNLLPRMPSAEEMDQATDAALGYQPAAAIGNNKHVVEYMAVEVPADAVVATLEAAFANASPDQSRVYKMLKQTRRVQPSFHVTLMHKSGAKTNQALWDKYVGAVAQAKSDVAARGLTPGSKEAESPPLGNCDVQLERVVFDDRVMAIVVRLLDPEGRWECVNRIPHITVGTRDKMVKPKESNDLLALWIEGQQTPSRGVIQEVAIEGRPVVKGTVRGVLSKF